MGGIKSRAGHRVGLIPGGMHLFKLARYYTDWLAGMISVLCSTRAGTKGRGGWTGTATQLTFPLVSV